ncbi:MAG: RagB/SusD family nutrient uptake outer membrane protein [Paludibacter sp.]|nr:RagB/SusD family nutrient uptake outer membrane protein [Paludibacter sp.]
MKKYSVILFSFIALSLLSSCSDWLNLKPEDGVIREEFWKTKEQVNSAVIGCYASLLNGPTERMFLWGELRADMLENGNFPTHNYSEVIDGEISASNPVVSWASLYTTINNCNTVLKFAPTVQAIDGTFTDKQLKQYEAEALTLRAMMYFYLVRSFRDVPLVLEASVSDDQKFSIPKTDGSAILDTLVRDLKIAAANAPIAYSSKADNKNRITSWTAKTLLADIYLWQEKYAECNALCNEIIGSGKFSLIPVERKKNYILNGGTIIDSVYIANESDADNMFVQSYVTGNSIESIFELPYTTLKNNTFYSILGPTSNNLKPKLDIVDGQIFPEPTYTTHSEATDIRGSGCSYRIGLLWKYVGTSRTGSPRISSEYTAPWIIYKYSDVLLMNAEALNQMGLMSSDVEAQNDYANSIYYMNLVRDARNAVNTSDYKFIPGNVDGKSLEKAILDERAREFSYEGKRWYDVLRYAKRGNYKGDNIQYLVKLAISSASPQKQTSLIAKYRDTRAVYGSHYWPIYSSELNYNKLLKQNEFYAQ